VSQPVISNGQGGEGMKHGALAIDENQGDRYGWSVDFATQAGADERASRECGDGCRVVLRFHDTCAAYYVDTERGSTVWAWATAPKLTSAKARAMSDCIKRGGKYCQERVWGCTSE
jgi:hypothetical protein